MAIDMLRSTTGVILPAEVSDEIWAATQEASAVMRYGRRITLPGPGVTIQTITGEPVADWVGETDEIAASKHTLGSKTITGYKLGVIEPFSNEFRRDLPGLYAELKRRLPNALATKYDATVFHAAVAPGANFDLLSTATDLPLLATTEYANLLAIDAEIAAHNGELNGYVLAPKARGVLLGALDGNDRPLFINDLQREGNVPRVLGTPVALSKAVYLDGEAGTPGTPEVIGFAGDFSEAMYGIVEDISVSISDQASITVGASQINLWQRDMFAVKVTVHLGFAVKDVDHFVKITGTTPTA